MENPPVFPAEFEQQHCPRVQLAKRLHRYEPHVDCRQFAECAFVPRGFGLTCETCRLHVSPVRGANGELLEPQDKYCEEIKEFYRQLDAYEADKAYDDIREHVKQSLAGFIGDPLTPDVVERMRTVLQELLPTPLSVTDVAPGVLPNSVVVTISTKSPPEELGHAARDAGSIA